MDSKGEESKISYPDIFFMIDSFEEVSAGASRFLLPLWGCGASLLASPPSAWLGEGGSYSRR